MRRFALLLALTSCQHTCTTHASGDAATSASASPADAAVSVEMTIESQLPKELVDTAPFGNDDQRAVCGRTITGTCHILQEKSAGKDAYGRDLVVVTVRTREPFDSGLGTWEPDDGVEEREHWVIARKDGNIVFRAPIAPELARLDVDVGASLAIRTNEIQLDKADVAPSSWNWTPSFTYRLSPPTLLVFSDTMLNSNPEVFAINGSRLDLRDGSGEGSFHCPTRGGNFFPVPTLMKQIDPARGLGTCAGDVDGSAQHGYMLHGATNKPSGWFRVAYFGTFIVEVHDDKFTSGDRLEVRLGRGASGMGCDLPPPDVVRKIRIDGAGVVSRPGLIEAKRIRDDGNVRTFELRFANPRNFDLWSGFAIDMVDDDGAEVRTLSTAGIGPELGSAAQLDFVACVDGPAGPTAVPLPRTDATVAAPSRVKGAIANVVRAWNDATNAHDATKLSALYADDLELYGTKVTRAKAVAIKNAAFAAHDRDTLYDLSVTKNHATFHKGSHMKDGQTIWVDGYIDVDASMRIVSEGDTTTDENLERKREADCLVALDAMLASTPEGKKAAANPRRSVEEDGPRWTVRYFAPSPGSKKEDDQLVASDEFQIDATRASIEHDGKPMMAPPAMSKVSSVCK